MGRSGRGVSGCPSQGYNLVDQVLWRISEGREIVSFFERVRDSDLQPSRPGGPSVSIVDRALGITRSFLPGSAGE